VKLVQHHAANAELITTAIEIQHKIAAASIL
jgi:hypothetical protein